MSIVFFPTEKARARIARYPITAPASVEILPVIRIERGPGSEEPEPCDQVARESNRRGRTP